LGEVTWAAGKPAFRGALLCGARINSVREGLSFMNHKLLVALLMAAAAAGCAAPVQDETSVHSASAALTAQECAAQRDSCFAENPLFGLFTCPLQYAQCAATASNGIPAQVTSAIRDTATCTRAQASCLADASKPSEVLACTETEAQCVAAIVDAQLPKVVTGTAQCVDDAVGCIRTSETASDLAGCADTLEACGLEQAVSALPPEVAEVVDDVGQCAAALRSCTVEAANPVQLTACSQAEIRCVAHSLGVTLPQELAAEALQCGDAAASCTLDARSVAAVRECAADLTECTSSVANPDAPLSCEQRWTPCLVRTSFDFLQCSVELINCRNPE
jgi:hypothetical protein